MLKIATMDDIPILEDRLGLSVENMFEDGYNMGQAMRDGGIIITDDNYNAIFLCFPIDAYSLEAHMTLHPSVRGKAGIETTREGLRWFFEETGIRQVFTQVRPEHRHVKLMVAWLGFKRVAQCDGWDIFRLSLGDYLENEQKRADDLKRRDFGPMLVGVGDRQIMPIRSTDLMDCEAKGN